jgi:hypothetical protein
MIARAYDRNANQEKAMVTDADFGYPAWRGFISWAFDRPDMRRAFEEETGIVPIAPSNDYVEKFMLWATEKHYGVEYAPIEVQKKIRAATTPT